MATKKDIDRKLASKAKAVRITWLNQPNGEVTDELTHDEFLKFCQDIATYIPILGLDTKGGQE